MRLLAVREHGLVVDFVWHSVHHAAARVLHCDPGELIGERLRNAGQAGPLGHPALVERYRRVMMCGLPKSFEQVHRVAGGQEVVTHFVVPESEGVAVTLTYPGHDRQAHAAGLSSMPCRPACDRQLR